MSRQIQIYALVNPVKQEPFYVGATISPLKIRLSQHLSRLQYKPGKIIERRRRLMRQLIKQKTPSQIVLLKTCYKEEADYYESHYYNLFTSAGFDLIQTSNAFVYSKQQENRFKKLADADKRKLKPYMEKVLEDHSESANDYKFTIGKV